MRSILSGKPTSAGMQHLETTRMVLEERARIARELHDVVAHYVSVIVIQADAAQGAAAEDPTQVREALDSIANLARRSMDEIRTVVGVLRTTEEADAETEPQPGLDALDELIERTRNAGLDVELSVRGTTSGVPAALELSAYRIVQESLTNVLKHAGAQPTRVSVTYGPAEIMIDVTNDGIVSDEHPRPGNGIIGMQERVALFHGDLHAGPRPDGGWIVRARLRTTRMPSLVIRRTP